MRRTTLLFSAILLLSSRAGIGQQSKTSQEQAVLTTDDQRAEALRRADPGPLERIYADDYSLVTSLGRVRSKADQITDVKANAFVTDVQIVERQIRMYGDVAVIVARQRGTIVQGGERVTRGDERVTRVYKNFGGQWKVISTHATTIQ
jgi:uncharacterized protein (TIGR02246 family)